MDSKLELIHINPFEDGRGILKKILMHTQLESSIEEVYILYSHSGSIRGNHYHKETVEYFTVITGAARIALKDMDTGLYEELIISADSNVVLKVPVNTVHAFKNEGDQPLVILAISSREYNPLDTDTFAMSILY